jgi:hypothetical protein
LIEHALIRGWGGYNCIEERRSFLDKKQFALTLLHFNKLIPRLPDRIIYLRPSLTYATKRRSCLDRF